MGAVVQYLLMRFLLIGAGVLGLVVLLFVLALIWRRTGR
ncbi:hypothetical protein BCF44_114185 [Kutzneria buriramensis]|uniref:Uncharacterized protein n=1 Tax=Kutzneria buriramensis TaxID=1045776 RepID=A0A3E0H662_9PSEU|nr:hypothetical protein BCF44_114185 [Kutzneria buriramensis]